MGSATAFGIFIGIAAAFALYKLFDALTTSNEEYIAMAGNLSKVAKEGVEELRVLKEKIVKYKELNVHYESYLRLMERELKRRQIVLLDETSEKISKLVEGINKMKNSLKATSDQTPKERQDLELLSRIASPEMPVAMDFKDFPKTEKEAIDLIIKDIKRVEKPSEALQKSAIDAIMKMEELLKETEGVVDSYKWNKANEQLTLLKDTAKEFGLILEKAGVTLDALGRGLNDFSFEVKETSEDEIKKILSNAFKGKWQEYIGKELAVKDEGKLSTNLREQKKLYEKIFGGKDRKGDVYHVGMTAQEARDMYAAEQMGVKGAKLSKEVSDEIAKLVKLRREQIPLEKELERSADAQKKTYESLVSKMEKSNIKILSGLSKYAPVKELLSVDEQTEQSIKQVQTDIDNWVEKYKTSEKWEQGRILDKLGFGKDFDKAKAKLDELGGSLVKFYKISAELEKEEKGLQIQRDMEEATREHARSLEDLTYELNRYHTVSEEVANFELNNQRKIEDKIVAIQKERDEIDQLRKRVEAYVTSGGIYNGEMEKDVALRDERVKRLEDEIKMLKQLNPILHEEFKIKQNIAKLESVSTLFGEKGGLGMRTGAYGAAFEDMLKAEKFRYEAAKLKAKEDIQLAGSEFASEKEKKEMLLALQQDHERRMFEIKLQWKRDWIEEEQKFALLSAERLTQQTSTFFNFGQGMLMAMKAAGFQMLAEQKTFAETIMGTSYTAITTMTDFLNEKTIDWLDNNRDAAKNWGEMMRSVLTDVRNELVKYINRLIVVAFYQQLIGMATSFIKPAASAGATGGSAAAPASGVNTSQFNLSPGTFAGAPSQYGGYIMGGTPGRDSVPLLGMPGEYMIPKDSVDYYGKALFDSLREKEVRKLKGGGTVSNNASGGDGAYTFPGKSAGGSQFKVEVNLINQTGRSDIEVDKVTPKIDLEKMVLDIIIRNSDRSGSFRKQMRIK
uniref:Putative tail tape measure protein n=1 Tax=viral metagenome TaxID=1070528 RepID=A0A6M3IJU6_9ZZZZ